MGEQSGPVRVEVRCWKCHRRYGPAPLLGMVEAPIPGRDGWAVRVAARTGRRLPATARQQVGGQAHSVGPVYIPDAPSRLVLVDTTGAVQLNCPQRRCTAAPREAQAALVKLAADALERGERVVYV
jgi:hypothetical protein